MSVKGRGFTFKSFQFPTGERHIVINDCDNLPIIEIDFEYESDAEIIELVMLADAIHRLGGRIAILHMPYVPYSRQDRINSNGESFSLKSFCNIVNMLGAEKVVITDPHSDVTTALLNSVEVIPQHYVFEKYFNNVGVHCLVSPDGGALKKIYKLAEFTHPLDVIECSKRRNVFTGEITETIVNGHVAGRDCYIVDDICDGGRTFIEIAKILKQREAKKIVLMVTHGFFTKGTEVFDGLIDEIYTIKGRKK